MRILILIAFALMIDSFVKANHDHHKNETDCRGLGMQLSHAMKEAKCMPRPSLEKLKAEPEYLLFPSMVQVNRCGGFCGNDLTCIPVKTQVKPILIRRSFVLSKAVECHRVYVIEHTQCKCGCNVMESDCNANQIYSRDNCACQCMKFDKEFDCISQPGMVWNPQKCKCTCAKPEEECSTGLEWVPSLCRCAKVMSMYT